MRAHLLVPSPAYGLETVQGKGLVREAPGRLALELVLVLTLEESAPCYCGSSWKLRKRKGIRASERKGA